MCVSLCSAEVVNRKKKCSHTHTHTCTDKVMKQAMERGNSNQPERRERDELSEASLFSEAGFLFLCVLVCLCVHVYASFFSSFHLLLLLRRWISVSVGQHRSTSESRLLAFSFYLSVFSLDLHLHPLLLSSTTYAFHVCGFTE